MKRITIALSKFFNNTQKIEMTGNIYRAMLLLASVILGVVIYFQYNSMVPIYEILLFNVMEVVFLFSLCMGISSFILMLALKLFIKISNKKLEIYNSTKIITLSSFQICIGSILLQDIIYSIIKRGTDVTGVTDILIYLIESLLIYLLYKAEQKTMRDRLLASLRNGDLQ